MAANDNADAYLPIILENGNGEWDLPPALVDGIENLKGGAEQDALQLVFDPIHYQLDLGNEIHNNEFEDHWWIAIKTFPNNEMIGITHYHGNWNIYIDNPPEINGYPSYPALGYPEAFEIVELENIIDEMTRLNNLHALHGSFAVANAAANNV